jgi:hypothetical protein
VLIKRKVVGVKKVVLLLSLMAAAALSWGSTTPLAQESTTLAPAQSVIPDQYIVVLEEDVRDPTAVARDHAQRYGAQVSTLLDRASPPPAVRAERRKAPATTAGALDRVPC